MLFSKLSDFCILEAIHPPKPLKKHRKYSCFCNPVDFMKIMIFAKKAEIREKIILSNFYANFAKKLFSAENAPKAPPASQNVWNSITFIRPGASGPRGTKKRAKSRKPRKLFRVF